MREGSNGYDPEMLNRYLGEIDSADDELLQLKVDHLSACKSPRARIKNIMKEARNSGVNAEAFRALVAQHRAERKIEQQLADLEADDRASYEEMQRALGGLGDLPLGQAALDKARPQGDALDSLGA